MQTLEVDGARRKENESLRLENRSENVRILHSTKLDDK